jgi:hypothetical protein
MVLIPLLSLGNGIISGYSFIYINFINTNNLFSIITKKLFLLIYYYNLLLLAFVIIIFIILFSL